MKIYLASQDLLKKEMIEKLEIKNTAVLKEKSQIFQMEKSREEKVKEIEEIKIILESVYSEINQVKEDLKEKEVEISKILQIKEDEIEGIRRLLRMKREEWKLRNEKNEDLLRIKNVKISDMEETYRCTYDVLNFAIITLSSDLKLKEDNIVTLKEKLKNQFTTNQKYIENTDNLLVKISDELIDEFEKLKDIEIQKIENKYKKEILKIKEDENQRMMICLLVIFFVFFNYFTI